MTFKRPQLFFDFDGPILDVSRRYHRVLSDIAGKKIGLNKSSFWKLKQKKTSWPEIFKKLKLKTKRHEFLKLWHKYIEKKDYLKLDKPQPGLKKELSALSKKYDLYLISFRQSRPNLIWQLKELNLDRYFKKVINCRSGSSCAWLAKAKSIKRNRKPGIKALIIGDTEIDIRAAKAAGIKSLAIGCGIRAKKLLIKEKPDFFISGSRGISKTINRIKF